MVPLHLFKRAAKRLKHIFAAEMDCMITRLTLFWRTSQTFFRLGGFFFFPPQVNESTLHCMGFLDFICFCISCQYKNFIGSDLVLKCPLVL